MRRLYSILCISLALTACAEKKKFGGNAPFAKTQKEPVVESGSIDPVSEPIIENGDAIPEETTPVPPVKPECDLNQKALTNVALLKEPTIKANQPAGQQTILYELSLVSCEDGSVIPLKDQNFQFDLNAYTNLGDMEYSVFDASTKEMIGKGSLKRKQGADLFGNVGPSWWRWENGVFSLPEGHAKIVMKLKLLTIEDTISDDLTIIETFFRIGDTKAVERELKFAY